MIANAYDWQPVLGLCMSALHVAPSPRRKIDHLLINIHAHSMVAVSDVDDCDGAIIGT